ncbi:MAG TPA: RdgB/HAM1 family non-canonical purine NTP pyrophosphatase [Vitreimonas sp.]|nr:RdgB/HAM1 family non-canonical purine NTP pyrophosphatase [Vitreimonas sp.]
MQLVLATQNAHKLAEVQAILNLPDVTLLSAAEVPGLAEFDVEETGQTFHANALLKAQAFAEKSGLVALADDSGLAVTALNGQPGVWSKRFVPGSDHDRNQEILRLLGNKTDRSAKFVSVLCLYDPVQTHAEYFVGEVNGHIGNSEKGTQGFGYDPLFIPEGYEQSFGELGAETKNKLSHRARAIEKLKVWLKAHLSAR